MCDKLKNLKEGSVGGRIKGQGGFVSRERNWEEVSCRKGGGTGRGNNCKKEDGITK